MVIKPELRDPIELAVQSLNQAAFLTPKRKQYWMNDIFNRIESITLAVMVKENVTGCCKNRQI